MRFSNILVRTSLILGIELGRSQIIHRNPLFLEDITDCIHTSKYIDKTENVMYVSIQSFDF